jgi:hypothetical protein
VQAERQARAYRPALIALYVAAHTPPEAAGETQAGNPSITIGDSMPRPPNYKQEKKRREDEKRKRNAEAEQRKSARKSTPPSAGDAKGAEPENP